MDITSSSGSRSGSEDSMEPPFVKPIYNDDIGRSVSGTPFVKPIYNDEIGKSVSGTPLCEADLQ